MKIPQLPDLSAMKAEQEAEMANLRAERDQARELARVRHDELLRKLDRMEIKLDRVIRDA